MTIRGFSDKLLISSIRIEVEQWPYHSSIPQVSLEYPLLLTHLDLSRAVFSDRSLLVKIMKGCTSLQVTFARDDQVFDILDSKPEVVL